MKLIPAAIAAAALLPSAAVQAQDAIVEGPGYRVGEGTVIHPSVGAETGYISNIFYEESGAVAAPLLRVLANLSLANAAGDRLQSDSPVAEPPAISFRSGLRLAYEEYLSDNQDARSQRNLGVGADLQLAVNPRGTFPIKIEDHFLRTNRPTNFESSRVLSRDVNHFKGEIRVQPPGRTLSGGLYYSNTIDVFESDQSSFANRLQQTFGGRMDWQFLPITRFFLDANVGLWGGLGSNSTKVDSTPVRALVGASTAVTQRTTIRTHAGYAGGFYSTGASYQGMLFLLEFGYRYSPTGRLTIAYDHDYQDSINANFYGDHRLKLQVDQQIARVMLSGSIDGRLRGYEGVDMTLGGGATRDDLIVHGGLRASYVVRDWLSLAADYNGAVVSTDFRTMQNGFVDDPGYVRHQAMLGATAAF